MLKFFSELLVASIVVAVTSGVVMCITKYNGTVNRKAERVFEIAVVIMFAIIMGDVAINKGFSILNYWLNQLGNAVNTGVEEAVKSTFDTFQL